MLHDKQSKYTACRTFIYIDCETLNITHSLTSADLLLRVWFLVHFHLLLMVYGAETE